MAAPTLPHVISGTVFDLYGNALAGATMSITHETIKPIITTTTSSDGKYILNLSKLDTQWTEGDTLTLTASKTAEGTKTQTTTIKGVGGQTENITLAETSDFTFGENTFDKHNLYGVIPLHYDKEKVTRTRPLPVQTEDNLEKYQLTDEDVTGSVQFISYTDRLENWYIQRYDTSDGTYRYSTGSGDYSTNWDDRTNLTYEYYYDAF